LPRSLTIAEIREHKEGLLLRFEQIRDRNTADTMRGVVLTIAAGERRDLSADEFWPEDLEGVAAYDGAGQSLGTVARVVTGGAQDRLVVLTADNREIEVPFVAALVPVVDLTAGRIEMDPPPGLFD
jgi:16S rRNA processing protein RimM